MALRTNSKKVKEAIKNYIMESFHDSDFEAWHNVKVSDYNTICNIVLSTFWQEKLEHDKRNCSEFAFFEEWCSGLPSIIGCEYYYNINAVDLLGNWLEQTENEKNRFSESEAELMITKLIYRELKANGHYLPKVKKSVFKNICGDFATYDNFGRSTCFECPEVGSDKHSTTLLTEQVHFIIVND